VALMRDRKYDNSSRRPESDAQIRLWIQKAKAGDSAALGQLIESCRGYLLSIARQIVSKELRTKCDPADLVQESSLDAYRDFSTFAGKSRAEFLGWLRQIVLHNVAGVRRYYKKTAKRDLGREIPTDLQRAIVGSRKDENPTPGARLVLHEQQLRVRKAVSRLPSDLNRIVTLRNYERLSFAEIGRRMNCSEDAARKAWVRALTRLRKELARDERERRK
jgi:RNA polymerase sigma-70 factor (ECF subfamily)